MRLFFYGLLPFLLLTLLVGAAILWTRTKRCAALIQLIACSIVSVLVAVDQLAFYLDSASRSGLLQLIRNPHVELVGQILIIASFVTFPGAYIWYVVRQKRI